MQRGSIRKRRGSWTLRYWTEEIGTDGTRRRRQVSKRLAKVSAEYPTPKSVQTKADEILAPYNRDEVAAEGGSTVREFGDRYFLPWIESRRRASTLKFYRDILNNHIGPGVGDIRLRDFQTVDAQRLLDSTTFRTNLSAVSRRACPRYSVTRSGSASPRSIRFVKRRWRGGVPRSTVTRTRWRM